MKGGSLKRFDYSYVIIGVCFLMVMITLGFCSSGRTLYLTAVTDALPISRGAYAFTDTFRYITTTIVNLFFGRLIARFGTKKLICAGFVCLITFALLNSIASTLVVFYLSSIILGVGLSWTGTTMVSVVVNKWCKKNKGTITGATLAANGVGGAVAVQIVSPIIYREGDPFGYRDSYLLVAVILVVMLLVIIALYREKNEEHQAEENVSTKKTPKTEINGIEYRDAIKKPYLYIALFCMFLCGMSLQGISGIAVPTMYDVGMDTTFVATIVSISGVTLSLAKVTVGFLYDRVGMRLTMNICFVCAIISMMGLILLDNSETGRIIAVVRELSGCFALPLETVMLPLFANELFGSKNFDKFVGMFVSASCAGFAIGYPFGNVLYDVFGDYNIAITIFICMMVFAAISMQFVLSKARSDRYKTEKAID